MPKIPFFCHVLVPATTIIIENKLYVYHDCEEYYVNSPILAFNYLRYLYSKINKKDILPQKLNQILQELIIHPELKYLNWDHASIVGSSDPDNGYYYGVKFDIKHNSEKNIVHFFNFSIHDEMINAEFELDVLDAILLLSNTIVYHYYIHFLRINKEKSDFLRILLDNYTHDAIQPIFLIKDVMRVINNSNRRFYESEKYLLHIMNYAIHFVDFIKDQFENGKIEFEKLLFLNGHGTITLLINHLRSDVYSEINRVISFSGSSDALKSCYLTLLAILHHNGLLAGFDYQKRKEEILLIERDLLKTITKRLEFYVTSIFKYL